MKTREQYKAEFEAAQARGDAVEMRRLVEEEANSLPGSGCLLAWWRFWLWIFKVRK
jgi:hypothetical protein